RLRPPVGWAAVAASGTVAGIGFTVSLLIATLAFEGRALEEAKLGVLSAALASSSLTWVVFRAADLLPAPLRTRALLGSAATFFVNGRRHQGAYDVATLSAAVRAAKARAAIAVPAS